MRINSMMKLRQEVVTVSDRTLASAGPAHPFCDSSWVRFWSSDRTLHSKGDQTRMAYVQSGVTYGDVGSAGVGALTQS